MNCETKRLDSVKALIHKMLNAVESNSKRLEAYAQLSGVSTFASMLAMRRGHNPETAAIESIGDLRLGMTRDEVETLTQNLPSTIYHKLSYNENARLMEIELINGRNILAVLAEYDIELFRTTVDELVPKLSEITPFVKDPDYIDGTLFEFPQLGLKLWREDNMTLNDLKDEKYTGLDKDEFEYYREKLYFDAVLIYSRDLTQ